MSDLEIWLIGTPDQITAAMTALATAGRIAGASEPEPMFGTDAGRARRYLRLSVPITTRTPISRCDDEDQCVIDLVTRRTA
jgi:hypothetical protein